MRAELAAAPLACPLDGRPLEVAEHGLQCARGHNYNVSRHGYVNLLPVKLKPSKDPGDDRAMVEARREVLDAGTFAPFAAALVDLVATQARALDHDGTTPLLVDAGCGDGHYTDALRTALRGTPRDGTGADAFRVLGVDISKWAVTAAAKRYVDAAWAVANNKRMPVRQGAASIVTSLFGFETWHPWADLQRRGQLVVTAGAGPRHLVELREKVYDEVRFHDVPSDAEALAAGYRTIAEHRVEVVRALDDPGLAMKVLAMTPHLHRMDADARRTLDLGDVDRLTLDMVLRVHRRE